LLLGDVGLGVLLMTIRVIVILIPTRSTRPRPHILLRATLQEVSRITVQISSAGLEVLILRLLLVGVLIGLLLCLVLDGLLGLRLAAGGAG
jgi:hypothetical protein